MNSQFSVNSGKRFGIVLVLLLSLGVATSSWSQVGRQEAPESTARIPVSPSRVDQPVIEIGKVLESEWQPLFLPPPIEPLEVSPKPILPIPTKPSYQANNGMAEGDRFELASGFRSGLDESKAILASSWYPKVSRGENWQYYCVVRVPEDGGHPFPYLKVYKNTGDPAATSWSWVFSYSNVNHTLDFADIEVVSSDDKGHMIFRGGDDAIQSTWWQLSNPSNFGSAFVTSGIADYAYCSLTSDEVEYNGSVYLYACWKEGNALKFKRSTDEGVTWVDEATVDAANVSYLMTGNAISYCPGDNHVFINYTSTADNVKIAESSGDWGTGVWSSTTVMSSATVPYTSGGITSMYGNYILATAHGAMEGGVDEDLLYVSSTDAGTNWIGIFYFDWANDQTYPSCASNKEGRFSIFFYDGNVPRMASMRNSYLGLSGGISWYIQTVDDDHEHNGVTSACIEDGLLPDFGGAWDTEASLFGTSYFGWAGPGLSATLIPVSPVPPVFTAAGGSLVYKLYAVNNTAINQIFDVWCSATKPNGQETPPKWGPLNLTLAPGASITSPNITQIIPDGVPSGTYSWNASLGTYPTPVTSSDHFPVVKSALGNGTGNESWLSDLDPFPTSAIEPEITPAQFQLSAAYPNPFNPTTIIRFQMPDAGQVNLQVFDTAGRLVATLVNGWREVGNHEVTFDGLGLASGVYLYQLHAGDYTTSGKMVLMK